MEDDDIAAMGFLSLIAQMAIDMKAAGLLTPEKISELEKRAAVELKNIRFNDDADEQSQINIIERTLSYLKIGVKQLHLAYTTEQ